MTNAGFLRRRTAESVPLRGELLSIESLEERAKSLAAVFTLSPESRRTREDVRLALGRRVARDLPPVRVEEVATQPAVLTAMDRGGVDLAILDGEAVPGGMGLCRQLKDEIREALEKACKGLEVENVYFTSFAMQ